MLMLVMNELCIQQDCEILLILWYLMKKGKEKEKHKKKKKRQ